MVSVVVGSGVGVAGSGVVCVVVADLGVDPSVGADFAAVVAAPDGLDNEHSAQQAACRCEHGMTSISSHGCTHKRDQVEDACNQGISEPYSNDATCRASFWPQDDEKSKDQLDPSYDRFPLCP